MRSVVLDANARSGCLSLVRLPYLMSQIHPAHSMWKQVAVPDRLATRSDIPRSPFGTTVAFTTRIMQRDPKQALLYAYSVDTATTGSVNDLN